MAVSLVTPDKAITLLDSVCPVILKMKSSGSNAYRLRSLVLALYERPSWIAFCSHDRKEVEAVCEAEI